MKSEKYIPNGELQGDTKAMPDRGTKTGMNGDTYGSDLSVDATNSSSMGHQGSDDADKCMPHKSQKI